VTRKVTTEQAILVAMGVLIGIMVTLGIAVLVQSGRIHDEAARLNREFLPEYDEEDDEG